MRKIVVSVYTTLDGIMDPLDWSMQFWSDEAAKYAYDLLFASDALIMGRETYEAFAASWPTRTSADDGPGTEGYVDRINTLPKYVASRTLQGPLEWNATLLDGDVVAHVTKLKEQSGQNILMYGAGEFTNTLMRNGLVDEVHVWVHPVVAGSGVQVFKNATDTPPFRLLDSKVLGSGVVVLINEPTRET